MEGKVTILFVLALVSSSLAINRLIPNGKELVYSYEAEIKGVSAIPTPHETNFLLTGLMIVTADTNSSFVRLADLKYQLANGRESDYRTESVEIPLPEELKQLETVFKIIYNENGTTIGIVTNGQEPEYVRNIKRSIASMLQLDVTEVVLDSKLPHAFVTKEQSMYGYSKVFYNVLPEKDVLVVQKMRNLTNDFAKVQNSFVHTNIVYENCKSVMDEPTTRDSQTVVYIVKHEGQQILEKIVTNGGIYYQQFEGKSELLYVYATQMINLRQIREQSKVPEIENQLYEDDISYYVANFEDETKVPDMTNGRRKVNMETISAKLMLMLSEMVTYMNENQITTMKPNLKDAQLVNRIMRPLILIDLATIEKVYTQLSSKPAEEEIFQQLLPLIGTEASIIFIRNLVQQKKVKDNVAIQMIQEIPMNVKTPNGKLLTEMEFFLNLGTEVSPQVRKAAILAFGTLMFKTEEHMCNCGKSVTIDEDVVRTQRQQTVQKKVQKVMQLLEKYVDVMVGKLKEATTYDDQMLFIQALGNTRLTYIVERLTPILRGELLNNRHLRALTMWAVYPAAIQDKQMLYELYWPILSDNTLHTELRIIAYYVIMKSSPSLSSMINISWLMNAETNHELYQFHYKFLQEMSQTEEPCKQEMRLRAAQILRYTYVPNLYGITGYYRIDYVDPVYNFGGIVSGLIINTEKTIVLRAGVSYNMMNRRVNEMTMLVKIHGLEGLNNLMLTTKGNQILTIEEIWQLIQQIPNNKNVHVEITSYKQDQVYCSIYYDGKDNAALLEIFSHMQEQQESKVTTNMRIMYAKLVFATVPTEIGFPAMFKIKVPYMVKLERRFVRNLVNNILTLKNDNKLQFSSNAYVGVSFYNPIIDIVQGAGRYLTYDVVLPLKYDITYNKLQQTLKISFLRKDKAEEDTMGFRAHSSTMVYIKDDFKYGVLKKSNPQAETFVVVSRGPTFRKQMPVLNEDLNNLGYKMEIVVFDNEKQMSNATVYNAVMMRLSRENKNYETPLGRAFLSFTNIMAAIKFQPTPGTGGLMVRLTQNPEKPVTSNELTIRLNRDVKTEDYVLQPAMKINFKLSYAVKNVDTLLKTWDLNAIFDVPSGHNSVNVKAQLTRAEAGQKELRMCLEGGKKYTSERITGKYMIGMSQDGDAKCTKDDAIIEAEYVGQKSEEQQEKFATYAECKEASITNHALHQYVPCYQAQNTIRKYVYDIKQLKPVPTELKQGFERLIGNLRNYLTASQVRMEEQREKMDEKQARVQVTYPTNDDRMQIDVDTPTQRFVVFGAPELRWVGFRPENTQFSRMYLFMQRMGLMRQCVVKSKSLHLKNKMLNYQVQEEYTMFVGDAAETPENAVFIKRFDTDRLALKLVHKPHVIEFVPKGHGYQITMDGQQITDDERSEDWVYYNRIMDTRFTVIIGRHLGIQVYYDGHHAHIEVPKMDRQLYGECMQQ